jgi:hypothetical protein
MTIKTTKEMPSNLPKILEVRTKVAEATQADLDKIRPFLLRDFSLDDLYIREMWLANDQVDRSGEQFDSGYLQRFAETIVGKSVLVGHEYGNAPIGRFFKAEVKRDAKGWLWVVPAFYMPKAAGNELERDNIDSGVWSYVSIGSHVDYAGLTCSICGHAYYPWYTPDGEDYCPHIIGQSYDGATCQAVWTTDRSDMSKVEAVEGSIVYLGCQYEAAISKSAESESLLKTSKIEELTKRSGQLGHEHTMKGGNPMDWEARAKELEAENERLKEAAEKLPEAEAKLKDAEPKIKAGEAYITHLKSEIIRIGGILDEPESAKLVADSTDDVEKLKTALKEYEARLDKKFPPAGKGAIPDGATKTTEAPVERDARAYSVI